jgi:hypothetical protein
MTQRADVKDPRGGVVQNLQGVIKESALCLDKIRNGIAGLASIIEKHPGAITEEENQILNEIFSPILDIIEGYSERVQVLKDTADEMDFDSAPTEELFEKRLPDSASRSTISAHIRRGDLVYRRRDTPID